MRILAISDTESPWLSEYFRKENLAGTDLILACGDLEKKYLQFLADVSPVPIFYVPGNHDGGFIEHPPEGCLCLDGEVLEYEGLRIAGLGGCMLYNGGPYQYSQRQMDRRARALHRKIRRRGGIDILVTHAPPAGLHEGNDLCHRGFTAFSRLTERWQPSYHIHGHIHRSYGANLPVRDMAGATAVLNVFEKQFFDCEPKERKKKWPWFLKGKT